MMALALVFLIALCVVATLSSSSLAAPSFQDSSRECRSETCQKAAQALDESMDQSVDPCDNFYKYACGGWIAKHPIPDDKTRYTTFDTQRDELSEKLAKSLKEATRLKKRTHPKSVINAANLFQGCIDEDARESQGLEPLKNVLNEIGGWPMVDSRWNASGYKWQKRVAAATRDLGISPIISIAVEADANKTSQHIIYLDQAAFGIGRNQLVNLTSSQRNIEIVAAYKNLIVSTGKLLNPKADENQLSKEAEDMIQFESELAQFSKPPEERRDAKSWYHKMTVGEVQSVTENKYFQWAEYLNDVLKNVQASVTDETDIILSERDYVKNAIKLANDTNPRILANYIGWRVLLKVGKHTTKEFRDNLFSFKKVETGIKKPEKLERSCTDEVVGHLGFAVGRLYVDEYFTEEDKKDAEDLVEDLRMAYELTLKNNAWMDEVTKNKALEKLRSMINMMGYPAFIKDDNELNEYYKSVPTVKKDEFFLSFMEVRKAAVGIILGKWNKPTNRSHEWVTEPPVVNAFYNPSANTITFPAGILNLPFYKYGRSLALNFGGIGTVVGHEMSHGFDDQGSEFDPEGNLMNWWSKETRDKFNEKADCFREQYSSYVEPTTGMRLNGNNSVGENIADNGGLRNSFIAYKMQSLLREETGFSKNKRLPGIQATSDQLFFVGYASIWCGTERKESLEMTIQYDTHSPNEYRVLVPLTNSRAFSEAYNCAPGTRMNPEKKCLMW